MTNCEQIKLVLLDVDGVLTDGRIYIDSHGEEIKCFDVKDGLGIKLLQKAGIEVGIITGRSSHALEHRLRSLAIELVYQNVQVKQQVYLQILEMKSLSPAQVAYMGDDLPDLTVLKQVGLSACPADAVSEVKQQVKFCCQQTGGRGAVRELAEFILKRQGQWQVR